MFHSPEGAADAPPCTPKAEDDEFTNISGAPGDTNDGSWQWGNQGGATAAWTNGELQITPDTTNAFEYLTYQTALPTAPYAFEIYVYGNAVGATGAAGNACFIGFRESATGKIVTTEVRNQEPALSGAANGGWLWQVTNSTSNTPGSAVNNAAYIGSSAYIKMQNDGSGHIKSFFSSDETNYLTWASQTITVPFTTAPNQLILGALGVGGGTTTCTFDFKRRKQ